MDTNQTYIYTKTYKDESEIETHFKNNIIFEYTIDSMTYHNIVNKYSEQLINDRYTFYLFTKFLQSYLPNNIIQEKYLMLENNIFTAKFESRNFKNSNILRIIITDDEMFAFGLDQSFEGYEI